MDNTTRDNTTLFELVKPQHDPKHVKIAREQLLQPLLFRKKQDLKKSAPRYHPDNDLATAINMALAVGAPLLLTGEPGTGKTQVAWYLGWYFDIEVFAYQVRSNSTADDMKYDFDAVRYLRNAQHSPGPGGSVQRSDKEYLHKRALWEAYEHNKPCVLLIDEIDKAPRDFPNDLLLELDQYCFSHPFEDRIIRYSAERPPIVVITSNAERRLPDAFLRRCIYHHIKLNENLVERAIKAWSIDFPDIKSIEEVARQRFWELRDYDIQKKPSTAELLVWLIILSAQGITPDKLREAPLGELPALNALVKDQADRNLLPLNPPRNLLPRESFR